MKRSLTFILCLSLILVLSLSLISAGWFSDFFGRITGNVVEGECIDSDSGDDIYTKGYRINNNSNYADYGIISWDYCIYNPEISGSGSIISDRDREVFSCEGEDCYVMEYHCKSSLSDAHKGYICPNGCNDGACIGESLNNVTNVTCIDSDGGKNYYVDGKTCVEDNCKYDQCIDSIYLSEYYCQNGNDRGDELFKCSNGCSNGACVSDGDLGFCGDGFCDADLNETSVSCPEDCEETQLTECEEKGGYCAHWQDKCKEGYVGSGPMDCPLGRSAQCCVPEEDCGKEGEKVNRNPFLGETDKKCCEGLTEIKVSFSYSVCVNCGDGVCTSPEDESNCPGDCGEGNFNLSIATLKDSYSIGEQIKLTDPPEIEIKEVDKGITGFVVDNSLQDEEGYVINEFRRGEMNILTERGFESESTNIQGYIIELKDDPILVKKNKLDKKAKDNEANLFFQAVAVILPKALEPVLPSNVQDKLENEIAKIKNNKEDFKREVLRVLGKNSFITGNVIGSSELVVLGEYENVFNGIALDITPEESKEIEKINSVKRVYPNYEVHATLMDSVPLINADDVWELDEDGNDCSVSGKICLTGKGVTIGIIDTGVDYTHEDLGGCFGVDCKVVGGYDFVNWDDDPMDDHGHGTHCAGIASGNGVLKGVAPDSEVYAYKVLDAGGSGSFAGVIAGIEKSVLDGVDIISLSLGGPGNPDDPMSQAIDNVVDAGVVAVIAAGNSGPGEQTIGSPGTARKAITIGASDKSDLIASFSSRGPVIWEDEDGNEKAIIKPDVIAPGVSICAAQYDSAWDDRKCLDEEHIAISGTSMATPHVAGAVALLKQKNPDWSPDEIKMALRNTAVDIGEDVNTQGYGRMDVLEGIESQKPLVLNLQISSNILAGDIEIIGSVLGENLQYYKLEYASIMNLDSWIEFYRGYNSVENDIIGNLDTTLVDDGKYILRLTGVDINGNNYFDQTIIKINNDVNYNFIDKVQGFSYFHSPFVVGDVNGNSEKEIIATESGGFFEPKIWVWDKDGNVLSGWPKKIDYWKFVTGNLVYAPALSDIDNDGINEVLLVSGKMVYAWNGDGTNIPGFPLDIDPDGLINGNAPESHEARFPHFSVGDLDNDGNKEIVSILSSAPFSLYNLEGKTAPGVLYIFDNVGQIHTIKILNGIPNSAPAIGDLNQDGKKEIVVTLINCNDESTSCGQSEGSKVIVLNKEGEVLNGWPVIIPDSQIVKSPILGDLNKDGTLEILVVLFDVNTRSWKLVIFDSIGNIIDEIVLRDLNLEGLPFLYPDISLGDVDGDNFPEIISRDGEKVIILDKDGNKLNEKKISSTSPAYSLIGDVDADGDKEILIWDADEFKVLDKNLNLEYVRFTNDFGYMAGLIITDLEEDNTLDIVGISEFGNVFLWKDLAMDYDSSTMDWPMFQHDPQHTGCYNCDLGITPQPERPQSKIVNHGNFDLTGNLIIKIQKKVGEEWQDYLIPVNQEITVPVNCLIKLDVGKDDLGNQVFAGFNNLDVSLNETGEYRVYAEFLEKGASWEFEVLGPMI
ncbi:S8 family serine peptidase [Candidatus Pacearchaeota archaeon]|nr:S8 family serine peptidase [Candidatus Pacearchaeota archaeon]